MFRKCVLMATMLLMSSQCFSQAAGGQVKRPTEPTGYDVYFYCNIGSATLYIDGASYGTVNGTRFLKTGQHSIMLEAYGYETLTSSISVNSANTSFSYTMKVDVLQQLINKMVFVEGGTFTMGATDEQGVTGKGMSADERPTHQVTLSSFYIAKYEVTQEEWEAVMGSNPSFFIGAKRPVEGVSWNDCQEFIRKLNEKTGEHFRLPTEAEWEYAARGGNRSCGYKYSGSNEIDDVGWHVNNSDGTTHDVGQKKANELGLYDMTGNVKEWCQDIYDKYSRKAQTNPEGRHIHNIENMGGYWKRSIRGGSWGDHQWYSRVSYRRSDYPNDDLYTLGFRLAQKHIRTLKIRSKVSTSK